MRLVDRINYLPVFQINLYSVSSLFQANYRPLFILKQRK